MTWVGLWNVSKTYQLPNTFAALKAKNSHKGFKAVLKPFAMKVKLVCVRIDDKGDEILPYLSLDWCAIFKLGN